MWLRMVVIASQRCWHLRGSETRRKVAFILYSVEIEEEGVRGEEEVREGGIIFRLG